MAEIHNLLVSKLNYGTAMQKKRGYSLTASCSYMFISLTLNLECTKGLQSLHFNVQGKGLACTITDFTAPHNVFRENYLRSVVLRKGAALKDFLCPFKYPLSQPN